jgi:cytochrome c oxidase cbb3-type subunit 4
MDVNLLRGLITAVSLACFIGIIVWAYAPRNKSRFDQDANMPFED